MTRELRTVYKRGRFKVVAIVTHVSVELDGKLLETYPISQVSEAVETVDEMAEREEAA